MGRMIEQTALAAGDSMGGIIDIGNLSDLETIGRVADVAIDFSAPAALPAVAHYVRATGTPLLSGVTGLSEGELAVFDDLGRFAPVIHSANYSLGVAVFRRALEEVAGTLEDYAAAVAPPALETARGLGLPRRRVFRLLLGECFSAILSAWLLAFGRAIAEVGAVSMVGGAIAWKTNVMTTAIMQYTNRGNFSLGIALGLILMTVSLAVNILVSLLQRRLSR